MDKGEDFYRMYLEGDDNGLVELIREYKDGLMLYISGITGNLFLAEELMEETFFKLAVKKPHFSGRSSFKTWIYTIGRNAANDAMRKRSRFSDIPLDRYSQLAAEEDLEMDYIQEEQKRAVHHALNKLNSDYRQVLYLTFFEDFSADEAAKIMKKSKKQIGNLLYRAKQALRTQLEKEGFRYENI